MAPMAQLWLRLGTTTITGWEQGPADGTPVLLLHGFPQTAHAWRPLMTRLETSPLRLVAPNMRALCGPEEGWDPRLDAAADDVLAVADQLGIERFHVLAHDIGGIMAWELAGRRPERVRSAMIASTPHLKPFAEALARDGEPRLPPFAIFRQPGVAEAVLLGDDAALLRSAY